jgi:D-alanyl-lipoteichoic acid acyltransferase DltB (MBOAT superfamily)
MGAMQAWVGVLCYAFQLYFDFSGYSDMAIGLSRMFGVTLPLNFESPYKSVNIIDFWHRWHMTLSRFLRDYLYIPLGGNRKGKARRHVNLLVTMLLGGLWHGAGWTFFFWGGLHGLYLVLNHGWHGLRRKLGQDPGQPLSRPMHFISVALTFAAVVVAWVFFRSDTLQSAGTFLEAMFGLGGGGSGWASVSRGSLNWIGILSLIVWLAPNTQQIMQRFKPALGVYSVMQPTKLVWQPGWGWLTAHVALALFALLSISQLSEFIYFRF